MKSNCLDQVERVQQLGQLPDPVADRPHHQPALAERGQGGRGHREKTCQLAVTMKSSDRRRKKDSGIGSKPRSASAALSICIVRAKEVSSVGSKPASKP